MEEIIRKFSIGWLHGDSKNPFGAPDQYLSKHFLLYKEGNQKKEEETIMVTRKPIWILSGIFVIIAWGLGIALPAGAETMNYKLYSYVVKDERVSIPDVEGHTVSLGVRKAFFVFENGEIASANQVATLDQIKRSGPVLVYTTLTFSDGSLIIFKEQGTMGVTAGGVTGEIVKGTGRFEGAKGTRTVKAKYLPVEKDELGPKGYGEGTITYTFPSK